MKKVKMKDILMLVSNSWAVVDRNFVRLCVGRWTVAVNKDTNYDWMNNLMDAIAGDPAGTWLNQQKPENRAPDAEEGGFWVGILLGQNIARRREYGLKGW